MTYRRRVALTLVFAILGTSAIVAACGSDGAKGDPGPSGAAGTPGIPGATGPAGASALGDAGITQNGACTTPCHTFGGVVDQWRFSNHSHPQESEIGAGPCGNCHGIDGLQQRVANNYITSADAGPPTNVPQGHTNYQAANGALSEINYAGATVVGRIHCSTCHDFNPTNDPHVVGQYVAGQAPLRIPSGTSDTVFIEKTAGLSPAQPAGQSLAYAAANTCIFCHKSRKDVALYITNTNTLSSTRWGPHEGPQADVYSGKGGYHFTGATYASSAHTTVANACVTCHMAPVAANGNVPDHTMTPSIAVCKTCHTQYTGTSYDIQGGQTLVTNALAELQTALNNAGMLTRAQAAPYPPLSDEDRADHQFNLDAVRPGSGPAGANLVADKATAGALYNYLIIARSKDFGVHNPTYAKQLLWDSILQIKKSTPTSLPARPE